MNEKGLIQLFYKTKVDLLDDCTAFSWDSNKFDLFSSKDFHQQYPQKLTKTYTPKQLVNTDSIIENVHFSLKWSSPQDIAIKLFQVNLSDLLSSGASPVACVLNMGIPSSFLANSSDSFIKEFAKSFLLECKTYNCPLVAGDSFQAPHLYFTLTVFGNAKHYLPRYAGKAQDNLYITGPLGLSLLGLKCLQQKVKLPSKLKKQALSKHLRPQAPYLQSQNILANSSVHAAIDISDGLKEDALKLAKASKLQLEIDLEKIPIYENSRSYLSYCDILASGEELELLFLATSSFKNSSMHLIGKSTVSHSKARVIYKYKGDIYPESKLESSYIWKHF